MTNINIIAHLEGILKCCKTFKDNYGLNGHERIAAKRT